MITSRHVSSSKRRALISDDQEPPSSSESAAESESHPAINPLSVQASSLVRSIDALSNIFWLCFLGFFLSIFFAGLSQLEVNTYTDYIFLGEYQVPKAILPLASLSFAVFAFWRPLPETIWSFESTLGQAIGLGLFAVGLGTVLYSTLLIDHFELFGLRQVWDGLMRRDAREETFVTPSLYRFVRHPLYVGWFVTLWATPTMTVGHLLFAWVCTAYILVAVRLEERDLVAAFGRRYEQYQATTPMFVPKGRPEPEAATA